MMEKLGLCGLVSWLIGLVAAIVVFYASVEAVTWIPALLIAVAVGSFLGLVLSHLICGGAEAGHGAGDGEGHAAGHGHSAIAGNAPGAAETTRQEAARAAETAAAEAKARAESEAKAKAKAAEAKARADAETAAKAADEATPDFDGDGVAEGVNEGAKPATLSAARGGKADNLKEIKGVGPKLEAMLNGMGFFHFDQIAAWSGDEVAWVNANLQGFKGRVSRDNWVAQAKVLAAGGETEFSKRVDKGEVY